MSIQVQLRRGEANEVSIFLGAESELVFNTDDNEGVPQDGVTVGGLIMFQPTDSVVLDQDRVISLNSVANGISLIAGGRVGIGVEPESDWNPIQAVLAIGEAGRFYSKTGSGINMNLASNVFHSESGQFYITNGSVFRLVHSSESVQILFAPPGLTGELISYSTLMRWGNNGDWINDLNFDTDLQIDTAYTGLGSSYLRGGLFSVNQVVDPGIIAEGTFNLFGIGLRGLIAARNDNINFYVGSNIARAGGQWVYKDTDVASMVHLNTLGDFIISGALSGTAGDPISFAELAVWRNDGTFDSDLNFADNFRTNLNRSSSGNVISFRFDGTNANLQTVNAQSIWDNTLQNVATWGCVDNAGTPQWNLRVDGDGRLNLPKYTAGILNSDGAGVITSGLAASSILAGTISAYASNAIPPGWLRCDGTLVASATYPDLFAEIGTTYGGDPTNFALPDLRGTFVRGWDNGRGFDPDAGRGIASIQADDFAVHTHSYRQFPGNSQPNNGDQNNYANSLQQPESTSFGGVETRPANMALQYVIKA